MARKRKWTARAFESQGQRFTDPVTGAIRADTSANVYESMLLHPAFTTMKPRQQMLYIACKAQFYGHRKPKADFPTTEAVQGDDCFYMNRELATRYGNYTKSMTKELYGDLGELQRRGFIECVSSGKATKSKSIYRFCSNWKDWKPEG